jgi:uncharacterized protein
MEFEWDEAKNRQNIRKHGFDFVDAEELFMGPLPFLAAPDEQEQEREERWRWRGVGMIHGRVVVAIFTERRANVIRFISLRKANQEERKAYEKAIEDELGSC